MENMITTIFAALLDNKEKEDLHFRERDPMNDGYNSGLGEIFKIDYVDEDYFHVMESAEANPKKFFSLAGMDLSEYNIRTESILELLKKYKIEKLNTLYVCGDTDISERQIGKLKELKKPGHFVICLGMFYKGEIFDKNSKDWKTFKSGFLPSDYGQ